MECHDGLASGEGVHGRGGAGPIEESIDGQDGVEAGIADKLADRDRARRRRRDEIGHVLGDRAASVVASVRQRAGTSNAGPPLTASSISHDSSWR